MSALLESLLTPGQRAQACEADKPLRRAVDRIAPPPVVSRAEQIVAEGERRRRAYRDQWPAADQAMVFGAQVGYLHGEVKRLCAELEQFEVTRTPGLDYRDVEASIGTVKVGYAYDPGARERITSARTLELTGDPGNPGCPSSVDVQEVWCNGVDLQRWVPGDELDRIGDWLLERHEEALRRDAEIGACRAEDGQ